MDRQDQLLYCDNCKNRAFDKEHGIICGLSGKIADFEGVCPDYERDPSVKPRVSADSSYSGTDSNNSAANKDMLWGAVWCFGGVIATMASDRFIFYGAIIFGSRIGSFETTNLDLIPDAFSMNSADDNGFAATSSAAISPAFFSFQLVAQRL